MPGSFTLEAWRTRLEHQGHRVIEPEWETVTGFTLPPNAETGITVAVEKEELSSPKWRERYFLCEPEPEPIFRVLGCPEPHRTRWLELVSLQPPGYWHSFLAGPGSWLLCRLARFREVVVWADAGLPWDVLDDPLHRQWGMVVPAEAAPFFTPAAGQGLHLPRLISVSDRRLPDAVAACMLFASVGHRDCYLADEAGLEVYLAYHDDAIFVSIPDAGRRMELLAELIDAPWPFSDVSGYASPADEEDGDAGQEED